MRISLMYSFLIAILLVPLIKCSQTENLVIHYQITGPVETNCYLIYGEETKEAALIDVGAPVDSLLNIIEEKDLVLKYFLFTHSHFDHIVELPNIIDKYPEAKVVMHQLDYQDIFTRVEWAEKTLGDEFRNALEANPEIRKIFDFDPNSFKKPDIFIDEDQILKLGHLNITPVHSPGHSPGSVCYHIANVLFSGDVLFYRTVGRTDVQHSSRQDQIKSVRRLYELFPDETKVYPGHGEFTDIGSEKIENKRITVNGGEWSL